MRRKPSETVQLKLRFPERLRVRIEAEAKKNDRSMNAEIVHRLEQSFQRDDSVALVKTVASEAAQAAAYLVRDMTEEDFRRALPNTISTVSIGATEEHYVATKEQRPAKPRRATAVTADTVSAVFQPGVRKR